MWSKIKTCIITALLLSVCWLCSSCVGSCSPNQMYQVSEIELMQLNEHLMMLEQNNETLQALLSESSEESETALNALMESRTELAKLRMQLNQVKADAESARKSLEIANQDLQTARQSFRESEREHDRIEGRLRTQRNIWEALFAVAVGVAIAR